MTLCLAAPLAVACGGDDVTDNPGADGGEEECGSVHNPCEGDVRREGGEVRWEYLALPDGNSIARLTTFFLSEQDTYELPDAGECIRLDTKDKWPTAQTEGREYIDVGESVTLTGADEAFVVERNAEPVTDFLARSHETAYVRMCHSGMDCDAESFLSLGTEYTVELAADDTVVPQTFENAIYMPVAFDALEPAFDGAFNVVPGEDMSFSWSVEEDPTLAALPEDEVFAVVGFVVPGEGPHTLCLAEADAGEFTVPAAVTAELPEAGTAVVGVITHQIQTFGEGDETREIDFLGMNCKAAPFTVGTPE